MEKVGIDPATTWFPQTDEATTAALIVKWIGWIDDTFGTETVQHLLPTLGVDGSLGLAGQDSPAKGRSGPRPVPKAAVTWPRVGC